MRKSKPNGDAFACERLFKIAGHGSTKPSVDVCPVYTGHEGGYQDRTRIDDVACRVLVVSIIGSRLDIAGRDLGVYIVSIELNKPGKEVMDSNIIFTLLLSGQ